METGCSYTAKQAAPGPEGAAIDSQLEQLAEAIDGYGKLLNMLTAIACVQAPDVEAPRSELVPDTIAAALEQNTVNLVSCNSMLESVCSLLKKQLGQIKIIP